MNFSYKKYMIIFVTATADDKSTTFLQVHNLVKNFEILHYS